MIGLLLLILLLLWFTGAFVLPVAGSLIHLLLAVVIILAVVQYWPLRRGG